MRNIIRRDKENMKETVNSSGTNKVLAKQSNTFLDTVLPLLDDLNSPRGREGSNEKKEKNSHTLNQTQKQTPAYRKVQGGNSEDPWPKRFRHFVEFDRETDEQVEVFWKKTGDKAGVYCKKCDRVYLEKNRKRPNYHDSTNHRKKGECNSKSRAQRPHLFTSVSHVAPCKPLDVEDGTRWKPKKLREAGAIRESDDWQDELLVRWVLNKITPSNFEKVVAVFLNETTIGVSHVRVAKAVDTIIARAAQDSRYARVYSDFCGRLAVELSSFTSREVVFRDVLLDCCRRDLSLQWIRPDGQQSQLYFEICRKRYIGSKRFVGELYNTGVLSLDEVISFVDSLLQDTQLSSPEATEIDEIPLEALCVLLDTCGKTLEETQPLRDDLRRCWQTLETFVVVVDDVVDERKVSFRMKHMVLDLLELRGLNWHPARYGVRMRKDMVAQPILDNTIATEDNSSGYCVGGEQRKAAHFAP